MGPSSKTGCCTFAAVGPAAGGQHISIDCSTTGAQQYRRAAGECGQCHVVGVRRKLNADLLIYDTFLRFPSDQLSQNLLNRSSANLQD